MAGAAASNMSEADALDPPRPPQGVNCAVLPGFSVPLTPGQCRPWQGVTDLAFDRLVAILHGELNANVRLFHVIQFGPRISGIERQSSSWLETAVDVKPTRRRRRGKFFNRLKRGPARDGPGHNASRIHAPGGMLLACYRGQKGSQAREPVWGAGLGLGCRLPSPGNRARAVRPSGKADSSFRGMKRRRAYRTPAAILAIAGKVFPAREAAGRLAGRESTASGRYRPDSAGDISRRNRSQADANPRPRRHSRPTGADHRSPFSFHDSSGLKSRHRSA